MTRIPTWAIVSVLTDITTVLLHPKLLEELFIPQPVATHGVIKQLLQDISATSLMKLDDYSMSKLWDLMTMIYKWQLSIATTQNIFDITRRHLKHVASMQPQYFPKSMVEYAMKRFEELAHKLSDTDYNCLRNTMILWFSEHHTKISVLMRLGLQRKDGTFNMPTTIDRKILQNLGENIYRYDTKKNPIEKYKEQCADTHEISCLLAGIENASTSKNVVELKLPLEFSNKESKKKILELGRNAKFENINTVCVKSVSQDLRFTPEIPKTTQQDLLDLLVDDND